MTDILTTVEEGFKKYGTKRENLLPIFQLIAKKNNGCISEDMFREIANKMDIPLAELYGVASFYTFLDIKPKGKFVIRLCRTISCFMQGKDKIIQAIEKRLKIKLGETTPDSKFTFLETNCIGHCHEGPAMLINNKVYTKLTPESAIEAIEECLQQNK